MVIGQARGHSDRGGVGVGVGVSFWDWGFHDGVSGMEEAAGRVGVGRKGVLDQGCECGRRSRRYRHRGFQAT